MERSDFGRVSDVRTLYNDLQDLGFVAIFTEVKPPVLLICSESPKEFKVLHHIRRQNHLDRHFPEDLIAFSWQLLQEVLGLVFKLHKANRSMHVLKDAAVIVQESEVVLHRH